MQYPLELTFKFWSLSTQLSIVDAQGNLQFYIRQKKFKLKEEINVFADTQRIKQLYSIKADRVIDFSACYHFSDAMGNVIGAVKRRGMKSLWKAHYDVLENDAVVFTIQEDNPWVKVMDGLFSELPIVGLFTGYVFNPTYSVQRPDGRTVMRLSKRPSFLSRIFNLQPVDQLNDVEESQVLLSLIMLILLERNRG